MEEKDFQNLIGSLKQIKLTQAEKLYILNKALVAPIESPYKKFLKVLVPVCLTIIISFTSTMYASASALPGDLLYPIKTKVVEPMLDFVNKSKSPEKQVAWQEEKIVRRIEEAESLAIKDKLDGKRADKLEQSVKKSSEDFAVAAKKTKDKGEKVKKEFKEKLDKPEEKPNEHVKKLKKTAREVIDKINIK